MNLVRDIARETGLAIKDVNRLINTAPRRYKVFPIPKRNGGERLIAQPASEIKLLQRIIMEKFISKLPVHDAAYAYVKNRSIRGNALRHVNSTHILKLDFSNFFNSIRPIDLERVLIRNPVEGLSPLDYENIFRIAFWGAGTFTPRCLSVGAPSSPMLSNTVMFEFDTKVALAAAEYGLTYTRYADDLTISSSAGPESLLSFERRIESILRQANLDLTLNAEKRGMYGRGDRRMVTGLIITPTGEVSIGRDRKRLIRSGLYNLLNAPDNEALLMWCKGMLSFVMSAEPSHMRSIYRKFDRDFIRSVIRADNISFYYGKIIENY